MTAGRRIATYLDDIGEQWLGYALPPVGRAVGEAQWKPDDVHEYCARCGDSVGIGEANETGCGSCRDQPTAVDRFVRLGPHSGALREWVLLIKFKHRWVEMAQYLGMRLGEAVHASGALGDDVVVVPMPMPWQRRVYRGIDHARVIAGAVGKELGVEVLPVLTRRNGPPQVALAPSMRQRVGARGLGVRWRLGGWDLDGATVVLVDDVRTTGASIRAASRGLRKRGAAGGGGGGRGIG